MVDIPEETNDLDKRLDLLRINQEAIEAKLSDNGIDPYRRRGLEFQLRQLEAPTQRIEDQIRAIMQQTS